MKRSTDPKSARWIITGRWRLPSAAWYSSSKRSGRLKSSWMVDISSDRFPKKIRTASKDKIPFVLIAGGDDAEAGAVSFRFRDGSQDNGVPVSEAVQRIVDAVRNRTS